MLFPFHLRKVCYTNIMDSSQTKKIINETLAIAFEAYNTAKVAHPNEPFLLSEAKADFETLVEACIQLQAGNLYGARQLIKNSNVPDNTRLLLPKQLTK